MYFIPHTRLVTKMSKKYLLVLWFLLRLFVATVKILTMIPYLLNFLSYCVSCSIPASATPFHLQHRVRSVMQQYFRSFDTTSGITCTNVKIIVCIEDCLNVISSLMHTIISKTSHDTSFLFSRGKTKSLSYKFDQAAEKQLVKDNTQRVLLSNPLFPYSYSYCMYLAFCCMGFGMHDAQEWPHFC